MFSVNADLRIKWDTISAENHFLLKLLPVRSGVVLSKAKVVRRKIAIVASEKARLAMF